MDEGRKPPRIPQGLFRAIIHSSTPYSHPDGAGGAGGSCSGEPGSIHQRYSSCCDFLRMKSPSLMLVITMVPLSKNG
jgi:hypothetical protein